MFINRYGMSKATAIYIDSIIRHPNTTLAAMAARLTGTTHLNHATAWQTGHADVEFYLYIQQYATLANLPSNAEIESIISGLQAEPLDIYGMLVLI